MFGKNHLQLLFKLIILFFFTQFYFSYGDDRYNLTSGAYTIPPPQPLTVTDNSYYGDLERFIVIKDAPEDSWDAHLTTEQIRNNIDMYNGTEESLRELFGDRVPIRSIASSYGDYASIIGFDHLLNGYEIFLYSGDTVKELVFAKFIDSIVFNIGKLAYYHGKSVKYNSKSSACSVNFDEKMSLRKERLASINKVYVSTLKYLSFDLGNPEYDSVANINDDGDITVNLEMARDGEGKELLKRFVDVHMSDIEMFKSKKIQPDEASTFYYIRYSKWIRDEAIRMILKEKGGDSDNRYKKTLVYLILVGAVYGDISSEAYYFRTYINTNKEYPYNQNEYINADFIKDIKNMKKERCF